MKLATGVNFINILSTHFVTIFWHQKLQSWNVSRERCAKAFCTKKRVCKMLMILFPKDKDKLPMLYQFKNNLNTVKPVYNDHPREPKFVAVVDRWSFFRCSLILWKLKCNRIHSYFLVRSQNSKITWSKDQTNDK